MRRERRRLVVAVVGAEELVAIVIRCYPARRLACRHRRRCGCCDVSGGAAGWSYHHLQLGKVALPGCWSYRRGRRHHSDNRVLPAGGKLNDYYLLLTHVKL